MVKEDIIKYIEQYAASFNPPIRFTSPVTSVKKVKGVFQILTPTHSCTADQVIIYLLSTWSSSGSHAA